MTLITYNQGTAKFYETKWDIVSLLRRFLMMRRRFLILFVLAGAVQQF